MRIDQNAIAELKQICTESFGRDLSDVEAQAVGYRIIRFLQNTEPLVSGFDGREFDPNDSGTL